MPTTVFEKSSWPMRQWWLATCITVPLSHILACNGWSAALHSQQPWLKSTHFGWRVGSFSANISGGMAQFPANPAGVERQTDRWTDRQNCDSNTVHCITCSRTIKIRVHTNSQRLISKVIYYVSSGMLNSHTEKHPHLFFRQIIRKLTNSNINTTEEILILCV